MKLYSIRRAQLINMSLSTDTKLAISPAGESMRDLEDDIQGMLEEVIG